MGTNFEWISPEGTTSFHIGKRYRAGKGECGFTLQGHKEFIDGPIVSWAQWKRIILAGGTVVDEYGREWDRHEFIAEVEKTKPENRRSQYDWVRDNQGYPTLFYSVVPEGEAPSIDTEDEWLCPDGFSFGFRDFS